MMGAYGGLYCILAPKSEQKVTLCQPSKVESAKTLGDVEDLLSLKLS